MNDPTSNLYAVSKPVTIRIFIVWVCAQDEFSSLYYGTVGGGKVSVSVYQAISVGIWGSWIGVGDRSFVLVGNPVSIGIGTVWVKI